MSVFIEPISRVVVPSGGSTTIAFNNIPQNYTDLIFVMSARSSYSPGTWADGYLNFQDGTGTTNYSWLKGDTTGYGTENYNTLNTNVLSPYSAICTGTYNANIFGVAIITITNYTSSTNKSIISEWGAQDASQNARVGFGAGLWRNSAAVTSASFGVATGWVAGSSVTLYGRIKQGI